MVAGDLVRRNVGNNGYEHFTPPYLTTAALSNHSHGNPTLALTNLSGTTGSNSGGFSLSLSGPAPGAGAAPVGSFFINLGVEAQTNALVTQASSHNSLFMFPLNPLGALPFDITADSFIMRASISGSTATQATAHTTRWQVGIYTLSNNGSFHLLNSVLVSYTLPTQTNSTNSTHWQGRRALVIQSSQWSSQPVFKAGSMYFIGILLASSSRANQTWGWEGLYLHSTGAFSGTVGVNSSNNTWMNIMPGHGIYSSNTTGYSTFPTPIANSQIYKSVTAAKFVPLVILNGIYGTF